MNTNIKVIVLSLLLIIGGCCSPCDKKDYGLFQLNPESLPWMKFAENQSRFFNNIDGTEVSYSYFDPLADTEKLEINCDSKINCGLCCEKMEGEFVYVQLANSTGNRRFSISLRKDLLRNDLGNQAVSIPDYLSISVNDLLECEITDVANASLDESVDLDGQTFSNVLKCEVDPSNIIVGSGMPTAIYFNKDLGIVGFKFEGEAVWRLRP